MLVLVLAALAALACALSSPEMLNDGKGTRDKPVPPRTYAHTTLYDVRALSVVWEHVNEVEGENEKPAPTPKPSEIDDIQTTSLRVQFQVLCNRAADKVCQLEELARDIKLVDASGILYDPVFSLDIEAPLTGEILGGAEDAGWLAYEVPHGVELEAAVAEYGEDQRVFFELP